MCMPMACGRCGSIDTNKHYFIWPHRLCQSCMTRRESVIFFWISMMVDPGSPWWMPVEVAKG